MYEILFLYKQLIKKHILAALDTYSLLSQSQLAKIYEYAQDKATLFQEKQWYELFKQFDLFSVYCNVDKERWDYKVILGEGFVVSHFPKL